ncbi:PucR family transcriptional regulator ligand-binding domain-containing protein [Streptomyces mirabilis]|nr:PucR family transcriptional regulator ligand-binding domain-containing protein [Streptomyces mirabilis]
MPALTLRDILALDPVRGSEPELLAGEGALDRPVRWVHSSEVYEGANFLDGGELLLTNGFGLTDADEDTRRRYVRELTARGAAGLAVEVGRSLVRMPEEVVDEARGSGCRCSPCTGWCLRPHHRGRQPGDRGARPVRAGGVHAALGRRPHRRPARRPRRRPSPQPARGGGTRGARRVPSGPGRAAGRGVGARGARAGRGRPGGALPGRGRGAAGGVPGDVLALVAMPDDAVRG